MSQLRRKILAFLLAPIGTALAVLVSAAVWRVFFPKSDSGILVQDASAVLLTLGYVALIAAAPVLVIGVPGAIVFARRGIKSRGSHLIAGCLAGFLLTVALAFAGSPTADAHFARLVFENAATGLGLGGATALVYWQIARPDVA